MTSMVYDLVALFLVRFLI